MSNQEFICGSDADDDDLRAYDEGRLVGWRRAPSGEMWYRRTIKALPAAREIHFGDGDAVQFNGVSADQHDLHAGDDADSNVEDDDHDAE